MDDRVKEHLKYLNKYCLLLAEIKKRNKEDFLKDQLLQGSAERFLQLAIESCFYHNLLLPWLSKYYNEA